MDNVLGITIIVVGMAVIFMVLFSTRYQDESVVYSRKFLCGQHVYIVFEKPVGGIVHDPDCPCHERKENRENARIEGCSDSRQDD